MIAFIATAVFFVFLISCGITINLYLYTRKALRTPLVDRPEEPSNKRYSRLHEAIFSR